MSAPPLARLIRACELSGSYCLIDGLAVNCYVEPLYTLDADILLIAASLPKLSAHLREQGFKIEEFPHSLHVQAPKRDLRIQFTTDERYQSFLDRSVKAEVLGVGARIASLRDVTQGKLWAYSDPQRRHPELKSLYPLNLRNEIKRG